MNLRRSILCLVVVVLLAGYSVASAQTTRHPLGDLGKPADYDQTLKSFGKLQTAGSDAAASATATLPSTFSWKAQNKVTVPKNQGSCGSCWAFASVGVFESKLLMASAGTFDLSEQQQVSCNFDQSGCDGGSSDALRFWEWNGPLTETCTGYPSYYWTQNNPTQNLPPCSDFDTCQALAWRTKNFADSGSAYYTVDTADIEQMKLSLQTDGPAYFRFDVYDDFYTFWDSGTAGSVYTQVKNASNIIVGGHAVLLIGWDDTKQAWLLKNSWGATSGPNGDGTFYMAYTGHGDSLNIGMANVDIYSYQACAYTQQTTTYNFTDIAAVPPVDLQMNDDGITTLSLPFPLLFYCQQYNSVNVDSNGLVHLMLSSDSTFRNESLPGTTLPEPLISPFWMDLAPGTGSAGGKVYAQVTGTAPQRVLIVEWKNVPAWNWNFATPPLTTGTVTFEMKYFESTGVIEYHYLNTVFSSNSSSSDYALNNGAYATIGIQRSGEEAVQFSYNQTDAIKSGQAIKFTPPAGKIGRLTVNLGPSSAVTAGATWSVDGGAAQNSGQSLVLLTGTHTVTFSDVTGYNTPTSQTVTVTAGGTTTATGTYVPQGGGLTVTIVPADAVTAGAQWQVDGGAWQNSTATVWGLTAGTHTVSFKAVSGYTTPASKSVTVSTGTATSTTAIYYATQTGILAVSMLPAEACTAGARWQIDGGAWQTSGTILYGLSVGTHTLSFKPVTGYTTPASRSITISNATLTSVSSVLYATPKGSLQVVINPVDARTAGAQWQVDGGAWQSSGATVSGLSVGTHTVSFKAISGYTTPANATVTISDGTTTSTAVAYYATQTGILAVSMLPAAACTAGARWQVDGGAWQTSGTLLYGVPVGTHTVSFKPVTGYTTPASRSVTISNATVTSLSSVLYAAPKGSLLVTISPADARTAGAQWQVDGGAWQSSGATVSGLSVETHTVSFKAVSGYTTPASKTVTISDGATTSTAVAYFATQTGVLAVSMVPADACTAGARWQVDGGAWQTSGTLFYGLSVGSHTVSFKPVTGYTTPASRSIIISDATVTSLSSVLYAAPKGSLLMTISPADARTAGAQWQVDGGAWQSSGATVSGLSVGTHTVSFKAVSGYTTPASKTVTISDGTTTSTAVAYFATQTGVLAVSMVPAAACTAGARWQVDGGAWQTSGTLVYGLSLGTHTVSFKDVSGYTTPASRSVTISDATVTSLSSVLYVAQ